MHIPGRQFNAFTGADGVVLTIGNDPAMALTEITNCAPLINNTCRVLMNTSKTVFTLFAQ